MERPTKPCHICGADEWWQRPGGEWVCGKCHPSPATQLAKAPVRDKKQDPEYLALLDRIRLGNDKLFRAWLVIRDMQDKEKREEQYDRWGESQLKLWWLVKELNAKYNFYDCLYIENGVKTRGCLSNPDGFWCVVCPGGPGCPYWEQELMALPGSKVKQTPHGDEFTRKLSGIEEGNNA